MPQFILETGGHVAPLDPMDAVLHSAPGYTWEALDAFTQGYIEALFFTENEPSTVREDRVTRRGTVRKSWEADVQAGRHKDMPGDYGFADLAPETLAKIIADCAAFQSNARVALQLAALPDDERAEAESDLAEHGHTVAPDLDDETATLAGRDFWYTRNRHGCGFLDGDWPEPYARTLTAAAKAFGEVDVYVGDDGRVYL